MAQLRNSYAPLARTGKRALFIVSVLLLNLVVSNFSATMAFAQTNASLGNEDGSVKLEASVTNDDESSDNDTEIEVDVDKNIDKSDDETELDSEALIYIDDESTPIDDESGDPHILMNEVDEDEEQAWDEYDVKIDFECWMQTSANQYSFTVTISADKAVTLDEEMQHTDPEKYADLLPAKLKKGEHSYTVSKWDGKEFEWFLLDEDITIERDGAECEQVSLLDVVNESTQHSMLSGVLEDMIDDSLCPAVTNALTVNGEHDYTFFAPSDAALERLVTFPGQLEDEIEQLMANPDEMCALISSHIVKGAYTVDSVAKGPITVRAIDNDVDGLRLERHSGRLFVDSVAVFQGNISTDNGVVHSVDHVLLPQSVATIKSIHTNKTSPGLSGMVDSTAGHTCVTVRIDGVPYAATVSGNTWSIKPGVVRVNPTKSDTLFDIVARKANGSCAVAETAEGHSESQRTHTDMDMPTGELLGLTMQKHVLSYAKPVPEKPRVLGTTDDKTTEEPQVLSNPPSGCGKGICGGVAVGDPNFTDSDGDGVVDAIDSAPNDPSISEPDTDGDGVVDSLDPDPDDPNVTGEDEEPTAEENDDQATNENDDSNNNVFWWFIVGGGVAIAAYIFRQRGNVS